GWHKLRNLSSDYRLTFAVVVVLGWSPDGSRIIILTANGSYIMGTSVDYLQPLIAPVEMNRPVWTADGRIAFMSNAEDVHRYYVMNADGSDVRVIAETTAPYYSFAWSPDGSRVAIVVGSDPNLGIEIATLDGQITNVVDG